MRYLIAAALLLISLQASAVIIYDVTFTGLSANAVGGAGVVTFNDSAFDSDGVFDSSTGVADLEVMLDGFPFALSDMLFSPQVDYAVQGGELIGFDWSADANFASLSGGLPDATMANTLVSTMSLFSLFAPCSGGICDYDQNWVRRGQNVAEPGSLLLISVGMFALALRRRT